MSIQSHFFWDFSTKFYARHGVGSACLDLQNKFDLDVNLILFCYWHAQAHGVVDTVLLERVINFCSSWKQDVVQPLRNVRTRMKSNVSPDYPTAASSHNILREKVKAVELEAEKFQQNNMEEILLSTYSKNSGEANTARSTLHIAQLNLSKLMKILFKDKNTATGIELIQNIEVGLEPIDLSFEDYLTTSTG